MSGYVKPLRQPMYRQLQERLREVIESGEFAEGEQFLTERQVVERYHVSRPTANKVLSGMAAEGRLEFRKGVGTFVRRRPLDYDVQSLVGFTQKALDAGRHPSTRVLGFDRVAVTEVESEIASHLRAKPGEALLAIGRLRLADGLPVILERRWLPAALFPGLNRSELRGSIYKVIAEKYRLQITESGQTIRDRYSRRGRQTPAGLPWVRRVPGLRGGLCRRSRGLVGTHHLSRRLLRVSSSPGGSRPVDLHAGAAEGPTSLGRSAMIRLGRITIPRT